MNERDPRGDHRYWNKWTGWADDTIAEHRRALATPPAHADHEAQFLFSFARKHWEAMLRRYSAGGPIAELSPYIEPMLDAWERSVALGEDIYTAQQLYTRNTWAVNLDQYICCFWLTGLALVLEVPDKQWRRLVDLMGNEGEDALLDRIIASRSPGRRVGAKLLHPKPYARLLAALDASTPQAAAEALHDFVQHWYRELDRPATKGRPAMYNRPYWHRFGDENFEGGAYFGRWCVEAVAAVKAFGLDDSLCLGHEHYPGDLLRPDGPSTHPQHRASAGSTAADAGETVVPAPREAATQTGGWLRRLTARWGRGG
jgi:hypothetical protein